MDTRDGAVGSDATIAALRSHLPLIAAHDASKRQDRTLTVRV